MAKGLDELIDWLVAETAYCCETGLRVDDFIKVVSRFNGRQQQKTEPDEDSHSNLNGQNGEDAPDAFVDMPLARKAWEWLTERPEILVGRNGSRGRLSLDDALAMPEPQPPVLVNGATGVVGDEDEEQKVDLTATALEDTPAAEEVAVSGSAKKGKKQVSFSASTKKEGKNQPRRGAKAGAEEAAAAAATEDPNMRPRLYVTERTLWYTLTGHDVDYKKVPLLEWKCLQGIASARQKGILQADLRILVNQDKRSVPKRTDFLAAKGYAVKRTTIARGYRTSMLWLTEFAPIELPDGDEPAPQAADADANEATPSLLTSKDLASNGIDFSPEFLTKDLEPVPWRNRWIGDAIEFASFGQTVLAIVKAWGVLRVVDLKIKMGIIGKRWQMRTLARVCREFVASGILRFVAAMSQDKGRMFKDCIKFERDPTPNEWAVYLAAGRRRTPMAELRAKRRKEQDRQRIRGESIGASVVDGDDQSVLDLAALEEEEEYEFGEGGVGGLLSGNNGTGVKPTPAWALDVPLANLIFDTVERAGIDGITSPEICRATIGPSFSRYIFTLIMSMARPGTQPDNLLKFQLHCEPTRVGRNNAYLFRTLENAKIAERLNNGEALEDIEQQAVAALADKKAEAKQFWDLQNRGKLQGLPENELRRLYGFAPPPPKPTTEELEQQEAERAPPAKTKKLGRPKKVQAQETRGRKKKVQVVETADAEKNGAEVMDIDTAEAEPEPPKRKRGRPPKARAVVEEQEEVPSGHTPPPPKELDESAEPLPMVRFGEPGSLNQRPKTMGRPRRSIVTIFRLDQLHDSDFLANQKGYKEGAIRLEPENEDEQQDESEEAAQSGEAEQDEAKAEANRAKVEALAADLEPVASSYNGKPGHLTIDLESKTLRFTYTTSSRRGRGRPSAKVQEPLSIATDSLVGDPVIRRAPGGDGQALILEARETNIEEAAKDKADNNDDPDQASQVAEETTWPFVFLLDDEVEDNDKYSVALHDILVALRPQPVEVDTPLVRRRGRQPGQKNKKAGKAGKLRKSGDVDAGPREFICETCSGVWKNLLGLQYHQTKARTACNPNYVPPPPEEKQDKNKRKLKELAEQNGQDGEADPPSLAQGRGRRELRQRKPPPGSLREASPVSVGSSRSHSPESASEVESLGSLDSPSRRNSRRQFKIHGNRRTPAFQLAPSEDSDSDNGRNNAPRGIAGAVRAALATKQDTSTSHLLENMDSGSEDPPAEKRQVAKEPVNGAGEANRDAEVVLASKGQSAGQPSTNGHDIHSQPPIRLAPTRVTGTPVVDNSTPGPLSVFDNVTPAPSTGAGTPARGLGPAGFRMPPLAKASANLSPFAVRSLAVMEIAKYLMDYYDGVFPSDRSLWYAAYKMYTRTFPGEDPPTLTVTKAAIKKLEMSKEAEEHTFGFRDPRGQFIYCRLLVRPGIDLFQSESAKEFKKQVQANYPHPYVPAEFMPSEKDMAILRILDKDLDKNARNQRKRRSLASEIEVLRAPFYEQQPQASRSTPNTVLVVGYGDGEEDGSSPQRRAPGSKRKDASGGASGQGTPKRRRTRFADAIAGQDSNTQLVADDRDDVNNSTGSNAVLGEISDNEADIDPLLRTVKPTAKPAPKTAGNPGLDSLPPSFFNKENKGKRPIQHRADAADGLATFVHFLPPNTSLEDGPDMEQTDTDYRAAGKELASSAAQRGPQRLAKFVTKTHVLRDMGKKSPRAWPIVTETAFQRQSDASFTMDGFMPTRKSQLRANLPQTPADCAAMLRGNQKINVAGDTPESTFLRNIEYCRSWEISQGGTDILKNLSIAPNYVFLNLPFPSEHYTAEMGEAEAAGLPADKADPIPPLRWAFKNQYTVESIPYGLLDDEEGNSTVDTLVAPVPASRKKMAAITSGKGSDQAALREKQAQQTKYVTNSRREMTAYPQKPDDYMRSTGASTEDNDAVDWASNDTLLAAFIVVKTLLGGLNQAIDWGLLMRLFPDKRLTALRLFWANMRRERQPHIDKLTERFQQVFLAAYASRELPPLDYDHVAAYDWRHLVGWAMPHLHLRYDSTSNTLPATRKALLGEDDKDSELVDVPSARTTGWREDFYHVTRSVWNRLQDSASEPATLSIDSAVPITPAGAAKSSEENSINLLRNMVARSWIRALCGTPHKRYQPSRIKQKLLTLGSIGADSPLNETDTNNLLQTVIGNLTTDRILRRTKSLVALGGRMYTLTEAYDNMMDKAAMEDKFRQAWAFKAELDATFRSNVETGYEIPLDSNDDGMVMALTNLQAHGRVRVEAIDAPHIPFGFEPGNYESRKFPKHYQRFRQRIVPTDAYAFNNGEELKALLTGMQRSMADNAESDNPPPQQGAHQEMPIWRDFFGVLDHLWFARLTGAVVFSLATRGPTPIKQTAAHLRPVVEPFEVQMIMDWANRMSLLQGSTNLPGSQTVAEWWWLLVGQMYTMADAAKPAEVDDKLLAQATNSSKTAEANTAEAEEMDIDEGV
ncbi:hypothetical protein SEUCBS140593_006933 [Sporothrix eucalyptigena]|uniref:TFIIIC transcription initiation factor complex subunits Tfc3 n=1 Tax=Sporothrix eucalyptigena TaxID=1812306 RepID=A0ABP0C8Z7_9PEZI